MLAGEGGTHHRNGGGSGGRFSTSFVGKRSEDFVNARVYIFIITVKVKASTFINYRKQKEKYSRVCNKSVKNTSRKKRTKDKREARPSALNTRLPIPASRHMHQQKQR